MLSGNGALLGFGCRLGHVVQYAYTVSDIDSAMAGYVDVFGVGP